MSTSSTSRTDASSLTFNLVAIALLLTLCGVAVAYAIDAAARLNAMSRQAPAEEAALSRSIGGRDLEVPLSWFRYEEQRIEGFARQIDLQLPLPLGPGAAPRTIELTLLPRSRARPSSRLLDGVYLHRFLPEQLAGVPGLVGKPLSAEEGFAGETVWYDPLSVDPFVAKCSAPVTAGATARCVRTVHLGAGIAAVYVFDEDVLANWRSFDTTLEPQLRLIGVL